MSVFHHPRKGRHGETGIKCTQLEKIFLISSTDATFSQFCDRDKDYDSYIWKGLTGEPSFSLHLNYSQTN